MNLTSNVYTLAWPNNTYKDTKAFIVRWDKSQLLFVSRALLLSFTSQIAIMSYKKGGGFCKGSELMIIADLGSKDTQISDLMIT